MFRLRRPKVLLVNVTGAKVDEAGNLVEPENIRFEQQLVETSDLSANERESVERALGVKHRSHR